MFSVLFERQFFSTRVAVRCGAAPTYSLEGT
jgi:hypothetical protein